MSLCRFQSRAIPQPFTFMLLTLEIFYYKLITRQWFCRLSLNLGLSSVCSWLDLGLCIFGKNVPEVRPCSYCTHLGVHDVHIDAVLTSIRFHTPQQVIPLPAVNSLVTLLRHQHSLGCLSSHVPSLHITPTLLKSCLLAFGLDCLGTKRKGKKG